MTLKSLCCSIRKVVQTQKTLITPALHLLCHSILKTRGSAEKQIFFYSEKTPKQDNNRQTRDRYLMWQTSRSLCSDHTALLFPVAHDVYLALSSTAANLHLTLSLRNTWQSLMSWLMSFNIKVNKDNNIMFVIFITSLTFNHNTEAILFFWDSDNVSTLS